MGRLNAFLLIYVVAFGLLGEGNEDRGRKIAKIGKILVNNI